MSTPTTRIELFGALEISHAGAEARRPPTQRVLALLGYLITHHSVPQHREKLVDLLWPDLPPRQGRRTLSDTLWRARRLLTPPSQASSPLLLISGDTVAFRPSPATWVDLLAFEQHLAAASRGEPEQLRAAIALYRGDLLEECYDDWVLYERERLRAAYLSALLELLAFDQRRGAYDAALQVALRLVRADPLREEGHRALMRLYYLLERPSEALRAYEQCRTVLEDELGVEPDEETESLYVELLALQQRRGMTVVEAGAVGAAESAARAELVREVALVGRTAARAEVMEAVEAALAGQGGLMLVAGEAGQGKSRLLREVVRGAEWRGAQVSWGQGREDAQAQPLGPLREALAQALTPLRAHQIAQTLPAHTPGALLPLLPELAEILPARPLNLLPSSKQSTANIHAALTSLLLALAQMAPQVVVLEDLHWFDQATLAALVGILPALRSARVLLLLSARSDELASRPAVWDTLLRLDRTGLLRRVELRGLSPSEVADLVRRALRMRMAAPRFSARLAEATGGNPFFVLETLRALHEQGTLRRDAQGVWHTPWDAPEADYHELPLPAGIQQALDGRLRELAPEARAALAAAAVLGQTFSPSVWASMTIEQRQPRPVSQPSQSVAGQPSEKDIVSWRSQAGSHWSGVVEQLLRRQFLAEDTTGYRFEHEMLRELIYDDLDARTRQALHLRAAEALEQEHYARVEALAQHLYLACAWDKAAPYLVQAGDRARAICAYRDALRNYDQALEAVGRADPASVAPALLWTIQLNRGAVATLLSEYPTAIAAYCEVLRVVERPAQAPGAPALQGTRRNVQIQALNGLTYVYGLRSEYAHARDAIRQAMALAAESPRLVDRAEVFFQAGLISYRTDDYAEARRFLKEAIMLCEALGHETERAKCLLYIGFSYLRQDGPTERVIEHLSQALEIYRQQEDRFAEHSCLVDIASAYLLGGKLVEVVRAVEPCLSFFSSIGALDDMSACLYLRGEAYRRMGQLDQALESLRESHAICVRLDRHAAAIFDQVCIAATLRDMGRYDEALKMLDQALQTDDRMTKTRALLVAADIWRIKALGERAWSLLEQGRTLAEWTGSKAYMGIAYRLLAQLRASDRYGRLPAPSSDLPNAATSFAESVRLLQEAHSDDELALTYMAYGQYLLDNGCLAEAKAALSQAQTLMSRCGMATVLKIVQQAIEAIPATDLPLQPGQRRVLLARRGVPRGRSLRPDELVEVIWTVEEPSERAIGRAANKTATRQERLRRLCAEALAQGAEPTVGALADALGVTARTIDRDIAALRAVGEVLVTRGASER